MSDLEESKTPVTLEASHLTKAYLKKKVVNALSFRVKKGEVVALLGSNGAGKTTAFYMTIGLVKPDSGHIFFQGKEITHLPIHKRARMGMGYLSQEPSVFGQLTVEQNISCILETLPIQKAERKNRLKLLLQELQLEKLAKQRANLLSGGERRRLEITRALVTSPTLLLLDEPFANVDPITIHDMKQMILHLKKKKISILITDHNAREISSIVDYSYLVQEGQATMKGTVAELLENKKAKATYFGEDFKL